MPKTDRHGEYLPDEEKGRDAVSASATPREEQARYLTNDDVYKQLRSEMGAWPERYWKAFPAVVRSIVTDYLKDRISERDFSSKINIALEM